MKKKKVLFILHYSPPIHGASKVGDSIKNSDVLKDAFITDYIKIKSSNSIDEIGKFGLSKILLFLQLWFNVALKLITFRPQVIYYTLSPKGFAFYRDFCTILPIKLYNAISGCKLVFHFHSRGIKSFTESSKIGLLLTNFLVKDACLVFISKIMKTEVALLKGYNNLFFLKNGVDDNLSTEAFEACVEQRIKAPIFNVLYLSNMMKGKGYDKVLHLAREFKNRGVENIHFNFAGAWSSDADKTYFHKYINEQKLEKMVTYHGLVKGDKKKEVFSQANVFVFPSRYKREIFPLSLLEALSYGLPIISFDIGATADIVTKDVGTLTDEAHLFSALKLYFDNRRNSELMHVCRQTFLEKYTTNAFENNLKAIVETI